MNKIGPRLVIWFTILLVFSLLFVSTIIYYLLSSSLRENDQELLTRLAENYSKSIETLGIHSIAENIPPEIFLSVLDNDGHEIFKSTPKYLDGDFEDDDEIKQVRKSMRRLPLQEQWDHILIADNDPHGILKTYEEKLRRYVWQKKWTSILPLIDNDMVEIYTKPMPQGGWIRVGRSSEDREEHLSSIRRFGIMVIAPFVLIGFLLSVFLARTILAPLKNLTQKVIRIRDGESDLRADIRSSGDEVNTLSIQFNSLLDHNTKLIKNLKDTLDNVAHDLRTPLTRFRIQAEEALQKSDTELQKEVLQNGMENVEKITALLNAIMDVSESESETLRLKKEKLNLKELIQGILDLYEFVAEDKNIELKSHISEDIFIYGDKTRLSQAFGNLLDNAIKYSPTHSLVEIQAKQQEHSQVLVSIEDQGEGIDPKDMENIWNRLYRADKSRSTNGLGIGLSLVKAIILAHSGQVHTQSRPQEGSTFFVTLPTCNDSVGIL